MDHWRRSRSPAYLQYAGPSAFRWTVSQKNPHLPADQWTTTQPKGPIYSGSLSNDRRIRPFRSGPLSTVHNPGDDTGRPSASGDVTVAPARKKRLASHPAVLRPPAKDPGHGTQKPTERSNTFVGGGVQAG